MSDLVDQLIEASHETVEHQGWEYRIEAVCSSDLVGSSTEWMLHLPVEAFGDGDELAKAFAQLSPDQARAKYEVMEAAVCAACHAIRAPGGEWADVCWVRRKSDEQTEASPPRLWIARLPGKKAAVDAIFWAVWLLSTDGGAAADRIASFRQAPSTGTDG